MVQHVNFTDLIYRKIVRTISSMLIGWTEMSIRNCPHNSNGLACVLDWADLMYNRNYTQNINFRWFRGSTDKLI